MAGEEQRQMTDEEFQEMLAALDEYGGAVDFKNQEIVRFRSPEEFDAYTRRRVPGLLAEPDDPSS